MRLLIIVSVLAFFSISISSAQDELIKDTTSVNELNEAIELVRKGDQEEAGKIFVKILKKSAVLPDEICYWYGKNLYERKLFEKSKTWIIKYLELEQPTQQSDSLLLESRHLLIAIEKELTGITLDPAHNLKPKIVDRNCNDGEMIICPVCKGTRVHVTPGKLGNIFETCQECGNTGYLKCAEYNIYIEKRPKSKPEE